MKRLRWRLLSGSAILITTLLLAACSDTSTGSTAPVSSKPVIAASGLVAPDFSVSTGQNSAFSLSDHKGDVVVLYFSFPGWPTCGLEAPALGQIQQEFGDEGLYVVAINTIPWASIEVWKEFWKSKEAKDVIWATDTEQELVQKFEVLTLGTTIIIDRQGSISYRDDGATPYNTLRREVEEVLWYIMSETHQNASSFTVGLDGSET